MQSVLVNPKMGGRGSRNNVTVQRGLFQPQSSSGGATPGCLKDAEGDLSLGTMWRNSPAPMELTFAIFPSSPQHCLWNLCPSPFFSCLPPLPPPFFSPSLLFLPPSPPSSLLSLLYSSPPSSSSLYSSPPSSLLLLPPPFFLLSSTLLLPLLSSPPVLPFPSSPFFSFHLSSLSFLSSSLQPPSTLQAHA